ncbi:PspC domain-containing protein [Paucibacter sp. APW11]|uniref:PspC domain-containing protein n=1 Tax=Roseateles aquae TaxID=3077235 RepID=A0ABU3PID1_9BURK|nr:PspC domain-containing protein [Paucibacter sp. APW11]MDT9001882.1 PspC domain-containing protein [Paucibacter sp. APW11]
MSIADDLQQLADMHQRGQLSDEEYARAKARVLAGASAAGAGAGSGPAAMDGINSLRRSRDDRWIGGVCGGIGRLTGIDAWIWRMLFTFTAVCAGTGMLAYLLLWIFVPEE